MTSNTERLDRPANRGYDWQKRSREIKEKRGKKCERCGDHNENYEYYPVALQTHHVVKGRHLPIANSRCAVNLVVVCRQCHGHMEAEPAANQYRQCGYLAMANTLELLSIQESVLPEAVAQKLDIDIFSAYGNLEAARRLRLANRGADGRYHATPDRLPYPAITKAGEKECYHTLCSRAACRKVEDTTYGHWKPCCQEHSPFNAGREVDLFELPISDPRSED